MQVIMISSPKWLSNFCLLCFSVYGGVSESRWSFCRDLWGWSIHRQTLWGTLRVSWMLLPVLRLLVCLSQQLVSLWMGSILVECLWLSWSVQSIVCGTRHLQQVDHYQLGFCSTIPLCTCHVDPAANNNNEWALKCVSPWDNRTGWQGVKH